MFHTQTKEIRKRTGGFEHRYTRMGIWHFHGRAICGGA
jgi:hypothetical protein